MSQSSAARLRKNSPRSKVVLARCREYDVEQIYSSLVSAVEQLVAKGSLIRPGERILVKPNLLVPASSERAVCTHAAVVDAVLRLIHDAGADALVGDSPGVGTARMVANSCGIAEVCKKHGVPIISFVPGRLLSKTDGLVTHRIPIAKIIDEVDGVFSVAKLKTHALTAVTGAVKNLYGCVPGLAKAQMHYRFKEVSDFARMLVELYSAISPRLSIIDGIMAMEGRGPRSGRPVPVGVLVASRDGVAADATACRIIGLDPLSTPVMREAESMSIGCVRSEEIEVSGASIDEVKPDRFELAPTAKSIRFPIPRSLSRLLERILVRKAYISASRCAGCGICVEACPADAITLKSQKAIIDQNRCIRCYCCHELCPYDAVDLSIWRLGG